MRIVIRIGGSVIASPINPEIIIRYTDIIKTIKQNGHEIVIVTGGGQLAREFIVIAKNLGLEMNAQDEVAISVSRLFAQLFLKKLDSQTCDKVATTLEEAAECLKTGKIAVMGGLRPGITTDTVAALVAERVDADLLLKGTDQEGIYNKDPKKHIDAKKLDQLSFDELQNVFAETAHKAGIHQIIDPEAVKVLKRKRVKLVVVNGFKPENILSALNGEKIGTVVN
ncbi:MAG TPA: UMP kinase [Candidatus Nanoarchaeia archaeon]|nr:UMP kinase [Candidatus Nanoarchaeia archaeon]